MAGTPTIETDAFRVQLLEPFDRLRLAADELPCIYEDPAGEGTGVQSATRQVTVTAGQVATHAIAPGTSIVSILYRDGTEHGAHVVRVVRPVGDGYVVLQVERQ